MKCIGSEILRLGQFFFRHQLLQKYKYYWRVEPGVTFFCDLHYDPFLVMQDEGKIYGFTISLYEYQRTIPTLWETTKSEFKTLLVCVYTAIDPYDRRVY